MYYVYILWSDTLNKKYVGITNDLKRRHKEHNSGKSNYTNRGKPWKLVYYAAFISKPDAENEELFLKSGKGRERIKLLLTDTFGRVA
jgi:putative endonuclease